MPAQAAWIIREEVMSILIRPRAPRVVNSASAGAGTRRHGGDRKDAQERCKWQAAMGGALHSAIPGPPAGGIHRGGTHGHGTCRCHLSAASRVADPAECDIPETLTRKSR